MGRILLPALGATVVAYLVCGIPFGMLVARAKGVDVRSTGSGNIGATNVGRSVGKGAAALTLLLDLSKGLVCTALAPGAFSRLAGIELKALAFDQPFGYAVTLVYLGCILGHVFSPYLGFHGGKGISVGFGAALGLFWPLAMGLLAVFIVLVVPTRHVSLGSVCAAVSLPLWCLAWGFSGPSLAPVAVAAAVVVWAHRGNIAKLARHEESRFSFHEGSKGDEG